MPRFHSNQIEVDEAESIALQVLAFLLVDSRRAGRFISLTGIEPGGIRAGADTHALQAAALEYLLADEGLLLTFCQEAGIDPGVVAPAYALLGNPRSDAGY